MPEQGNETSFILSAARFAAGKHKTQKRKDGETPYINHPLEVADILSSVGRVNDAEILAAALLHDTIEDTGTTIEELRTTFGDRVVSLVQECTDDKSLPKAERKRLQVEHAPHKSDDAKLIKIADKISNMRSVTEMPPTDWSLERKCEYIEWCERVFIGLKGVNFELDQLFMTVRDRARESLGRLRA